MNEGASVWQIRTRRRKTTKRRMTGLRRISYNKFLIHFFSDDSDDRESGELTDSDGNYETTGGKQPKVECEEEEGQPPAKKFRTGDVHFRRPHDDVDQGGMDQSTSSNWPNQGQNIKQSKRGGKNRGRKGGRGNGQQNQQQEENPKKKGGKNRNWKGRKGGGSRGAGRNVVKREQL
jgi:hypothetical protein